MGSTLPKWVKEVMGASFKQIQDRGRAQQYSPSTKFHSATLKSREVGHSFQRQGLGV